MKWNLESVKKEFEKRKYILLSDKYKNNKEKLSYICKNGHRNTITFDSFRAGHGCLRCKGRISWTFDMVKEEFEKIGYILTSNSYINRKKKLNFVCDKGHYGNISFECFLRGQRCRKCYEEIRSDKLKLSYDFVKSKFEEENFQLLSKVYTGCYDRNLEYICPKGHKGVITWQMWNNGHRCKTCSNIKLNRRLELKNTEKYEFVKNYFNEQGYVLLSNSYENQNAKLEFICPNGHKSDIAWINFYNGGQRCGKCHISKEQIEVYEFIKHYFNDAEQSDRNLICPRELDIVIPSAKTAIEYCGLYWHREQNGKPRNYHLNKLTKCNEKKYRLITLFEDEWKEKPEITKARILNILGVSEAEKIYARNCIVSEINTELKTQFLNKYHIQGSDNSITKLGAFYNNKLVSVMTFSKPSIAKGSLNKDSLELSRFCSDYNYNVIGIASKLFKYFRRQNDIDIFSYADRRWSNGNLYNKLGFKFDHFTTPNYWYVYGNKRVHRFNFRKSVLKNKLDNFDPNLSEYKNMLNNNIDRVWDCGNIKYEYTKCL